MWHDVRTKELDSLGRIKCFASEFILPFEEDVESEVFLPRQRVRMRGNAGERRVIDEVAIERFTLEEFENQVSRPLSTLFPLHPSCRRFRLPPPLDW